MTGISVKATLIEGFDGIVCDLDGVVYRGHEAVPHAVNSLLAALSAGVHIVYATNNASRAPVAVAAHLDALGLPGPAARVVTSAQAAAELVARRYPPGSRILAVGGHGVSLAVSEAGLFAVSGQDAASAGPVVAVVQGYGAQVAAADLAEIAFAVQGGALWVATNVDNTLPTERGLAPGNGALVGAVRPAVSVDPIVVGKPYAPLYDLSVSVLGTGIDRTLAIGDRLDTDIVGANAVGMESLLVLGGVHGWTDVVTAKSAERPRYVATDLRALHSAYSAPVLDTTGAARWVCGAAQARVSAKGELAVSPGGTLNERLRAALWGLWHAGDIRGSSLDPHGGDGAALSRELDLATAGQR